MPPTAEDQVRADIVEVGRRLYARGLIAAHEGNISVRLDGALFITPAGVCKGYLKPEDVVRTDQDGGCFDGSQRVSSEIQVHLAVYRRRPEVAAVVHAHPPTATGFAAAGLSLDQPLIAESVVTLGAVPVIPYGTPSTGQLAENVSRAICHAHGMLLANHGALTVGETLQRAWERMETLEHLARVVLTTRLLGHVHPLREAEVARLEAMRAAVGYPPPACTECPSRPTFTPAAEGDRLVLTRDELVRLIAEAVQRFGGA